MIHVFAVDPELVATWHDQLSYNMYFRAFGLGTPRILACFPINWGKLVYARAKGRTEIEKKRIEELIHRMTEVVANRPAAEYDVGLRWRDNADAETLRVPFDLILDSANIHIEVERPTDSKWDLPRFLRIPRTAEAMAGHLQSMLSGSQNITFIDPYFTPAERFTGPLCQFIRAALMHAPSAQSKKFEIHTSATREKAPAWIEFEEACTRILPGLLPNKLKVRIARWKPKPGGDRMHNRYVLTDLGGVLFANGLDESSAHETDDLTILSREALEQYRSEYMGPAFGYDLENELQIEGTRVPTSTRR